MSGLAETLRARREGKGLSQRHLAELMGVHENTVAKLERHPERSLLETIERAALALDTNTAELFSAPTVQCGNRSGAREIVQMTTNADT
jgi:transcriptional regulator with XRE-family HTH domain